MSASTPPFSKSSFPEKTWAAIPDLHGCHRAASAAVKWLQETGLNAVFLGDYCDRGESSILTVDALIDAREKNPDWKFLMGNHEQALLKAWHEKSESAPFQMERTAFEEYTLDPEVKPKHQPFYSSLLPYFETESLLFCHGGVQKSWDKKISDVPLDELFWSYYVHPNWQGKKIVRGHAVVDRPLEDDNSISCETGVWLPEGNLAICLIDDSPERKGNRLLGWQTISRFGEVGKFYEFNASMTSEAALGR